MICDLRRDLPKRDDESGRHATHAMGEDFLDDPP
jgi:hypothetical protein